MTDPAPSPKRRRILSSINTDMRDGPDKPTLISHDNGYRGRSAATENTARETRECRDTAQGDGQEEKDTTRPRRSRLKLKSQKSRRHRSSREKDDNHDQHERHGRRDYGESSSHSHKSSRRHHRHRHRDRSPTPPNPHDPPPLDPEAAFRESLFDAMADDEGAAYWESVYGQPIHVYGNEKVGPAGELEQMTEDEYASYVRQKMWEKTHAGLLEERAKREERRKQKKGEEELARKLRKEMEQSLRRGEERRQKRRWAAQWEEYTRAWASWDGARESLAWPIDGNERNKITEKDVRSFYIYGLDLESIGEREFVSKLKDERVRWHPDKMQQRLGGKVDDEVMRDVTAVFQIIDKLWADIRQKT
ncbi:hypothetical protein QQS21_006691 [Conoideocrella luteorostrata]|uniref:J domain-containing protein n=1 Tax=Conoideocrella luteorostrata TaxID=1105319 RepID=A0AAJ0CM31_9HYPO|nr:hypothetical protein QQS21_006691 [Conoideocrella luteorostrata]